MFPGTGWAEGRKEEAPSFEGGDGVRSRSLPGAGRVQASEREEAAKGVAEGTVPGPTQIDFDMSNPCMDLATVRGRLPLARIDRSKQVPDPFFSCLTCQKPLAPASPIPHHLWVAMHGGQHGG